MTTVTFHGKDGELKFGSTRGRTNRRAENLGTQAVGPGIQQVETDHRNQHVSAGLKAVPLDIEMPVLTPTNAYIPSFSVKVCKDC